MEKQNKPVFESSISEAQGHLSLDMYALCMSESIHNGIISKIQR